MLANYLITAFRHLRRERGYAAINLFGLAVGLALCLLVIQLAAYQLSIGDFHEKKDQLYRILKHEPEGYWSSMPIALGTALKEQVPEVEETVRFLKDVRLFRVGEKSGTYEDALWTESSVFEMFSLPLLRGDSKTALSRPYTMVLTESLARRLFGERDPMGQVIRYNEAFDCIVTGIVGEPPSTSLLQFSALLSLATVDKEGFPWSADSPGPRGRIMPWITSSYETFVQLHFTADAATVAERIPAIVQEGGGIHQATDSYTLQPLKSLYFDTEIGTLIGPNGDPMHLAMFATLAMVLLTIAGFNYVNLATARAQGRLQEAGIRKALGAHRLQLVRQLLCESVLLSVAATLLAVAMAETVTPFLPAIGEADYGRSTQELATAFWSSGWTLSTCAGAAVLATAVGLAAGAYPAWVVACSQPAVLERGGRIGGARLRQGLILAQFTVTATLMTMTLLIWHQVSFIQSMLRDNSVLGPEPEQVVIIDNRMGTGRLTADQARAFKADLIQDSRIAAVSLSTSTLVPRGFSRFSRTHRSGEGGIDIRSARVDGDFAEILRLRMVQGRLLTERAGRRQSGRDK